MLQALATGALAASLLVPAAAAPAAVPWEAPSRASLSLPFPDGGTPAPVPPPPGQVTVDLVTVNGFGCPAGTTAVAVSPDNTAFTVTYSDYLAQVGVGARPIDARKNCQLSVQVHVPQGFTYAVAQADYRGYAYLERGASGTVQANYYFQGMSQTASAAHTFRGPRDADWQATDQVDVVALAFAPCGEKRNLNVNTSLRLSAGTSDTTSTTSFMTMDSTDGSFSTTYHFAWAQCPAPAAG